MSDVITLETLDADGAIAETRESALQDTRLGFLKKAGVGAGAVMGGGAVLGAIAPGAMASGRPPSKFGKGDIGILNFALVLEYLEATFYNEATANLSSKLDARRKSFLSLVTADENTHVRFLKGKLGSKAIAKPRFNFGTATTDPTAFTALAQVLENTGVHAYLGQAPNLKSRKFLAAAGSIATIEARHAALINDINGSTVTPDGPFDTPLSASKVLAAAGKFIV